MLHHGVEPPNANASLENMAGPGVDNNLLGSGQDKPGGHNLRLGVALHDPLGLDLGKVGLGAREKLRNKWRPSRI